MSREVYWHMDVCPGTCTCPQRCERRSAAMLPQSETMDKTRLGRDSFPLQNGPAQNFEGQANVAFQESRGQRSPENSGCSEQDTNHDQITIPVVLSMEDHASRILGMEEIKKISQEADNHDWIQRGLCIFRPFTAALHLVLICPCYLVISTISTLVIILRSLFLCLGLISCDVKPPEQGSQEKRPVVFFDGAGWAFPFSMGVSKYIRENYDVSNCKIYAISAGNIAAVCLLLDRDPTTEIVNYYSALRQEAVYSHFTQPLCGYCSTLKPIRHVLEKMVPDDVHIIATGRYHAVVTPWPQMGLKYLNTFRSKEEFIDAVLSSMALPLFVYRPLISRHDGWRGMWLDGGLQTLMTPIDHLADVSVRTLSDPLSRFRNTSMHPPASYGLRPLEPLIPPTMNLVLRKIELARTIASEHVGLKAALAPYARKKGMTAQEQDIHNQLQQAEEAKV